MVAMQSVRKSAASSLLGTFLQDPAATTSTRGTHVTMPNLNDFLSRIQTDYAFYLQFRKNPEEALTFYELNAEERAALNKPDAQIWDRLGWITQRAKCLTSTNHFVALGSDDPGFDPAATFALPEVQQKIGQIRGASAHTDRLAAISALIDQLG